MKDGAGKPNKPKLDIAGLKVTQYNPFDDMPNTGDGRHHYAFSVNKRLSEEERTLLFRLFNYAIQAYSTTVPTGADDLRPENLK